MKKLLIVLTALTFLASVALAASADAEKLYKTRCIGCHGIDGGKTPPGGNVVIKGKSAQELLEALQGYKAGTFGGKGKKIMESQVKTLDDAMLKDLADFVSGL